MSRFRIRGAALVATVMMLVTIVGVAHATTVTVSGTDNVSGYSLYSAMSITNLGGGNYRGTTYGEAVGVNVNTIHNRVLMKEWCNFSLSTDVNVTVTHNNVSWVNHIRNAGYANDWWDCPFGQAIMQDTGQVQWINTSPSLNHTRWRFPCLNIRAGGFCP